MDHQPVLAPRVVELLRPALEHGGVFVDATLGRAGHARRLLEAVPGARLVALDRDPEAVEESRAYLSGFEKRVRIVREDFARLSSALERLGIEAVRGVLFDLGVSSPQLDRPERGFSFRSDGPLDMRMDPSQTVTASQVVNEYPVERLATLISRYGEERWARRIARAVVSARPIEGTRQLASIVVDAIPAATRRTGPHPARRTFQALRIEVNDELGALESALPQAIDALAPGGRVVVISYHSLEDRIVKQTFASAARDCTCPPDFPVCICGAEAKLRILTRRPAKPGADEVEANPRASAAKLRAGERLEDRS